MKTIVCNTKFDITPTGVLGQYKENREIVNHSDQTPINNLASWTRARNQQRNWETLTQIISLRCLPENITQPICTQNAWSFSFEVESLSAISDQPDDLYYLMHDANGVPMILGLDEDAGLGPAIETRPKDCNTWFRLQTP